MAKPPIKEKYIKDPAELLAIWDEYKLMIDNRPDVQDVAAGKGVHQIQVRKPYQKKGFFVFFYRKKGFHVHQYFDNYKNAYDAYLDVVTCIRDEWEEDQIEGTLTGRYKSPNLVARLNGYVERVQEDGTKEVTIKVKYESKRIGSNPEPSALESAESD